MSQSVMPSRQFGFWSAHFVVIASMIGAGILTTSGFTLRETGSPQALLGLWLLGGIMALAGAVTVAELATMLPKAGGDYLYVREAFGPGAGFVSGWSTFVLGFAAPTAVVASTAINYLFTFVPTEWLDTWPSWLVTSRIPLGASIMIALVTIGHCFGHRQSSIIQVISTCVKLLILFGLALLGLLVGKGNWNHLSQGGMPTYDQLPALGVGLIYIGYAYSGWNGASYLAGEVRDPRKLIPRALITGCLVVIGLYLLLNLTFVYALDPAEMKTLPMDQVARVAELAASRLFGSQVSTVLSTLLGLTLVASVSAYLLAGPRVMFAMARDGYFFRFVGRLHPRYDVPVASTIMQGLLAICFLWSGTFLQLLDYTSVGLAALSGLTVACVYPLRKRRDLAEAYRIPFYPLPPLLYLCLTLWTVTQALMQSQSRWPTVLSLATIGIGIALGWAIKGKRK
ncbi:MAG TPA: APC family permease [Gemmatales bacterium]|nr:APC family permease [Gemmatales bacterium]